MICRRRTLSPGGALSLALAVLTLSCAAAPDDAWSRFRGPGGNGISAGSQLKVQWEPSEASWKTALPGKGHASPVVWGDRVFVLSGNVTNASRHILCIAGSDGTILWRKDYDSQKFSQNRENSFGSATPAVDGTGVYVYWTTPDAITVAGLTHDGKEKWIRNLGSYSARHGSGASPVVCENLVWINNDQDGASSLLALDVQSGATKHSIQRRVDKASYGTPCLLQPPGGPHQLIFASTSHGLTAVDPRSGAVLWDATNLFNSRVVSSPISSDGLVICSSGEGGVGRRLVAVRPPSGQEPAAVVYDSKSGVPNVPTPLAKDGRLFILCDNGLLRCVRTGTGEQLWQERLPDRFYASPIWAENRLYLVSKAGRVFVVAAADKYELLATNALEEPTFATPAIAGRTIFFRTESSLIAVRGFE